MALYETRPGKPLVFRDASDVLMKVNGSVANPDVANPPAIAIPEALALPDAGRTFDIGRAAVIAVSRTVIARAVIAVLRCDRAADDGATDQPSRDTRGNTALGMGRGGHCHSRNSQRDDGSSCHQCLLHGLTFPVEQATANKRVCRTQSFIFRLND